MNSPDAIRRSLVFGAAATGALAAGTAVGQTRTSDTTETDTPPKALNGQPMPEPSPAQSAGPVAPWRGSNLAGKVPVVTGAARGIGRAIAVELAANGADLVALDIAGPVSPASDAIPATPEELDETVRQITANERRGEAVRADIRDIAALRQAAGGIEQTYGKIDIVVADAAFQRWERYENRLSESIGETRHLGDIPTPEQAWDVRAPTAPMRVGWVQPDDISPVAVFLASDAAIL
jgi:short chain dehydrogenase